MTSIYQDHQVTLLCRSLTVNLILVSVISSAITGFRTSEESAWYPEGTSAHPASRCSPSSFVRRRLVPGLARSNNNQATLLLQNEILNQVRHTSPWCPSRLCHKSSDLCNRFSDRHEMLPTCTGLGGHVASITLQA